MYATTVDPAQDLGFQLKERGGPDPAWVLMYGIESAPFERVTSQLRRRFPGVSVFGATSFQGVFTAAGFTRKIAVLVGEASDETRAAASLRSTGAEGAAEQAQQACEEIVSGLGVQPNLLLLHATPGFEEKILVGVQRAFGNDVPVYGGSAAADSLDGNWQVFANGSTCREGFVLVGFTSPNAPLGGFVGGFLPTEHRGTITRVDGRLVHEIDGQPAAKVYDAWTGGAIAAELVTGGNVLLKTSLLPVARTVGSGQGLPRRLLSHPHEVFVPSQSLSFFTELSRGDSITLMTGTRDPLVARVHRVVQRARGSNTRRVQGGLLVFCGGSLGGLLDQADRIANEFASELSGAPFIGLSTFGEQGAFFHKSESLHGNLMCAAVLF